jgi:hypothetical protein
MRKAVEYRQKAPSELARFPCCYNPRVKKLLCLMLALWFGLAAGLAQAHATAEDLHQLKHAVLDLTAAGSHDTGHDEHCDTAHCGHALGVATAVANATMATESLQLISTLRQHATRFVADDIDRPKWADATSAVASL